MSWWAMTNYESNAAQVKQALARARRRTLEGIGVFVDGEASLRSPVLTGNLRASINHRINEAEQSVTVGTPVEYGPAVELGYKGRAAQPFLRPAVESNITRIKRLAEELMKL